MILHWTSGRRPVGLVWLALLGILTLAGPATAITYPDRPGDREFIADTADLLTANQEEALREKLDKVLTEMAIPIIVVTIKSLAAQDAGGMGIATYARSLYDEWGIGHKQIQVRGKGRGRSKDIEWNKGILLLISPGDRKARIELGAGFGHEKDALCESIMQQHIIPPFKRGDFPGGIVAGAEALGQMARGEVVKPPPRPPWHYALLIGGIALTIFTVASLIRRGAGGWAWIFWGVVLSLLWMLIYNALRSGGSSGFGGGSFGGGFSGGGGATGSW